MRLVPIFSECCFDFVGGLLGVPINVCFCKPADVYVMCGGIGSDLVALGSW